MNFSKLKDKAASAAQSVKKGSSALAQNIKTGAVNLKDKVQGGEHSGSSSPNSHSPASSSPMTPRRAQGGGKEEAPAPIMSTMKEDPQEAQARNVFRAVLDFETDEKEASERTLDFANKDLAVFPKELREKTRLLKIIKRIDLSGNYIPHFPRELYKWLEVVEWIDISRNRIQRIPDGVEEFNHLHTLILHHNRLDEIPRKIAEIKNLRRLDVSYNLLTELPSSMWMASELRELKISGNRFTNGFPVAIARMEKLDTLEAKECFFTEIPKEIAWLDKLETLDLTNNLLESLPEEIGHLQNLINLNLTENPIRCYPLSLHKLDLLKDSASTLQLGKEETMEDNEQIEASKAGTVEFLNLLQKKALATNYKLAEVPHKTPNPPKPQPIVPTVVVEEAPSDPEVEKKVAALSDWTVKNSETTKTSLIAIKNQMAQPGASFDLIRQLSLKTDAVCAELESKKSIIPKYRDLELPPQLPSWNEIDRIFKNSEAKIYHANTCLTMISRHVVTLTHSSKLEEVVSLVKLIRALQAALA